MTLSNSSATSTKGSANLGGTFTFPHTSLTVNRLGYGAMKLTGPQIWGPPADTDAAIALLREAVAAGVNHIDTSDFYGPHVSNQTDQAGAASLSSRPDHRQQTRRAPRTRQILDPRALAPGINRRPAR